LAGVYAACFRDNLFSYLPLPSFPIPLHFQEILTYFIPNEFGGRGRRGKERRRNIKSISY
jgi:hypothetical protein